MNTENLKIKELRKSLNLSQADFSAEIGIKQGSYSDIERGKIGISGDIIKTLVKKYRISPIWLYEDIGDMLLTPNMTPNMTPNDDFLEKKVSQKGNKSGNKTTSNGEKSSEYTAFLNKYGDPLIPAGAMAGFGSAESTQVFEHQIEDRYIIPEFKGKVDFFIRVTGSSMYPKYNSGDIVACKKIEALGFVQWNKTYVLDTTQGALVKRLIKSNIEGNIICRSDNKDYPDFELNINDDIYAIALIIGVIRFE